MKYLFLLLPILMAVSCAPKPVSTTMVRPTAPTLHRPAVSEPADLKEATEINRALREGNQQLDSLLVEGREVRYELNRKMKALMAQKSADEEELNFLSEHMMRQQALVDHGKKIVAEQEALIEKQSEKLIAADLLIATGEIEKAGLRDVVEGAEAELEELSAKAMKIMDERGIARVDAAEGAGTIAALEDTAFFRLLWAISVSILLVALLAWRVYRFFNNPLKLLT